MALMYAAAVESPCTLRHQQPSQHAAPSSVHTSMQLPLILSFPSKQTNLSTLVYVRFAGICEGRGKNGSLKFRVRFQGSSLFRNPDPYSSNMSIIHFPSAALPVDSNHMTASSSTSWVDSVRLQILLMCTC